MKMENRALASGHVFCRLLDRSDGLSLSLNGLYILKCAFSRREACSSLQGAARCADT